MFNQPILGRKSIVKPAVFCALLMVSAVFWGLSAGAAADAERECGKTVQIRTEGQLLNTVSMSGILERRDFEKETPR
ncbi:MAG: hypothetical protein FWG42_09720 [Clostridiales bacterium]|nr:hypothetical protein [Clostridiales bacterium]